MLQPTTEREPTGRSWATMRIMPIPLKLSVLDQSPAAQDMTQDQAIRESLALARHCEASVSPLLGLGASQQREHRRHRPEC